MKVALRVSSGCSWRNKPNAATESRECIWCTILLGQCLPSRCGGVQLHGLLPRILNLPCRLVFPSCVEGTRVPELIRRLGHPFSALSSGHLASFYLEICGLACVKAKGLYGGRYSIPEVVGGLYGPEIGRYRLIGWQRSEAEPSAGGRTAPTTPSGPPNRHLRCRQFILLTLRFWVAPKMVPTFGVLSCFSTLDGRRVTVERKVSCIKPGNEMMPGRYD